MTTLHIDREAFERDGFIVIPDAFAVSELQALQDEILVLLKDFDPSIHRSHFKSGSTAATDAYSLKSGSNISYFLEENSFNEDGTLKYRPEECMNKVAHALHDLNPVFEKFSYHPLLLKAVKALGHQTPSIVQSMYIFKASRIGGTVNPHQDTTFVQSDPPTCIGTWVSLQDATKDNGCLYIVPGSHKAPVERWFNLNEEGTEVTFNIPNYKYNIDQAVPVEVKAGTLVILHGAVVHFSGQNYSELNRNAYSLHMLDLHPSVAYPRSNWIRRDDFRNFERETVRLYGQDTVDQFLQTGSTQPPPDASIVADVGDSVAAESAQ